MGVLLPEEDWVVSCSWHAFAAVRHGQPCIEQHRAAACRGCKPVAEQHNPSPTPHATTLHPTPTRAVQVPGTYEDAMKAGTKLGKAVQGACDELATLGELVSGRAGGHSRLECGAAPPGCCPLASGRSLACWHNALTQPQALHPAGCLLARGCTIAPARPAHTGERGAEPGTGAAAAGGLQGQPVHGPSSAAAAAGGRRLRIAELKRL